MTNVSDNKKKQILNNTALTLCGGLLMNGVLQLLVYPWLNRELGSAPLGDLLFIMGLAGILGPSVGQALNASRLVARRDYPVTNGDYDRLLLLFGGVGTAIVLLISFRSFGRILEIPLIAVLLILMVFRYYGDVEYRISLNYRRYFVYYAVLTAGYLLGYLLYRLTGLWPLIFLCGEFLCLFYLWLTGSVFRRFFEKSEYYAAVVRRGSFLILSYVITNVTLNLDRVVLYFLAEQLAVTQYYAVSLIGKTMVLLVIPINTIIISYLTRREKHLDRREFHRFVLAGCAVALLFFLIAQVVTPVFLKLFYSNLYPDVRPYITIVNASQILGLLAAYLFIVVLTFTGEKWQMILQVIHLIVIVSLSVPATVKAGLYGFSIAVLVANAVRVGVVIVFGTLKSKE